MDTIVLNGTGPSIRLRMASDLRVSEDKAPIKVTVIDGASVTDVSLDRPKLVCKLLNWAA